MRKLNLLWKVLRKENDDPVKQIHVELKRKCFEKNWTNEVIGLRSRYGLPICDEEVQVKLNGVKRLRVPVIVLL